VNNSLWYRYNFTARMFLRAPWLMLIAYFD